MAETNTDSSVIYFTRLHWVIFFGPILGLGIAIALYVYIVQLRQVSLILIVFALLWILMTWVTYYFSSITIKRKQVILRTGIIIRQTVDIPLSKIETIDIRQSILGSILRYGSLVITGTGGTRHLINFLHHPLTCRRYIEQLMNEPQ
ncbi:PH domain-containing protein [Legionella worsleiensis]|uniref:Transmembrane protein n=1 Tax=Legionella worsleiensis TaxID=45076 RepID=A0A0W1A9E3_9GAMM|nr:PH domain-containing protein [Legionella worsleiensis]KTD77954.1 transmembrane protein [Legionella worsleiensis]STY31605.1 transmembrane protein [Legionella worsleiensis]